MTLNYDSVFKVLVNDDKFATLLGFTKQNQYDCVNHTICMIPTSDRIKYNNMKEHIMKLRCDKSSFFHLMSLDVMVTIVFEWFFKVYRPVNVRLQFWRHVPTTIITSPRQACCTAIIEVPHDLSDNYINVCCEKFYLAFRYMQKSDIDSDEISGITLVYLTGTLEQILEKMAETIIIYQNRTIKQIHDTYIPYSLAIVHISYCSTSSTSSSSIVSKFKSFFKNIFN